MAGYNQLYDDDYTVIDDPTIIWQASGQMRYFLEKIYLLNNECITICVTVWNICVNKIKD